MGVARQSNRQPDGSAVNDDRALIALASAFALAQLALHLWGALSTRDPKMGVMHAIALLYLSDLPPPPPRDDVLVVGHTGRWVYGQITADGHDRFIDALDGVVLEQKENLALRNLHDRFQAEIDRFLRFQKKR